MANIGDRVRLKSDPTQEGVIIEITPDGGIRVQFDDASPPKVLSVGRLIVTKPAEVALTLAEALAQFSDVDGDDDDGDDTPAKARADFFGQLQRLARGLEFSDDAALEVKGRYQQLFEGLDAPAIRALVARDFPDLTDFRRAFQDAEVDLLPDAPPDPTGMQQLRAGINNLTPRILSAEEADKLFKKLATRLQNLTPTQQQEELNRMLSGGLYAAALDSAIDSDSSSVFDEAYRTYVLAPFQRIAAGFAVRDGAPLPTTSDVVAALAMLESPGGLLAQKPILRAEFLKFIRAGLTMPAPIPGAEQLPFDPETFRATAFEVFFGNQTKDVIQSARPDLTLEGLDFLATQRTIGDSLDNLAIKTQLELRARRAVRSKFEGLIASIDRSISLLRDDEEERFLLLRDMKLALESGVEVIADSFVRDGAPAGISVNDWVNAEVVGILSPLLGGTDLESVPPDAILAVRQLSGATIAAETARVLEEDIEANRLTTWITEGTAIKKDLSPEGKLAFDAAEPDLYDVYTSDTTLTAREVLSDFVELAKETADKATVEGDLGERFRIDANAFELTLTDEDKTAFAKQRSVLRQEFIDQDGAGGFDAFIAERLPGFVERAETQAAAEVTAEQRSGDLTTLVTQRITDLQKRLDLPQFQSEADQAALTADIERLQVLLPTIGKDFADLQAEIEGQAIPGSEPFGTREFFESRVIPGQDKEGMTVPLPPGEFVGGPDAAQASVEAGLSPLTFAPRGPLTLGELPTVGRDIESRFKGFIRNLQLDSLTPQIKLDPRGLPINPGKLGLPTLEEFNREVQLQAVAAAGGGKVDSVILDQAAAQVIASIRGEGTIDRPGGAGEVAAQQTAAQARTATTTPRRTPPRVRVSR